jgi:hypothetical protein
MLETDRREYRRVARHSFDRATASPRDINKNLSKLAGVEETNAGSVAMSSVHKIHQLMGSSLRKSPPTGDSAVKPLHESSLFFVSQTLFHMIALLSLLSFVKGFVSLRGPGQNVGRVRYYKGANFSGDSGDSGDKPAKLLSSLENQLPTSVTVI